MGFLGIIYGNCCSYMFFNMALWFIPCLFSMELFYWFICKMNHSWQIVVALISLNVLGINAVKYLYWLPWGVNAAMVGMIFFGLGNLIKSNKDFIANVKWYYWMLTVGGMSILQYLMYDCSDADLACLKFVNPILYVPIAFIGIALYFSIAKVIRKNCLLEWIGRNTFVLFAFQEPVFRAVIYSVAKIMQVDVEMVRMNVYFCVLCTILTIIVIAPLIVVYNKCIRKLLNKIAV